MVSGANNSGLITHGLYFFVLISFGKSTTQNKRGINSIKSDSTHYTSFLNIFGTFTDCRKPKKLIYHPLQSTCKNYEITPSKTKLDTWQTVAQLTHIPQVRAICNATSVTKQQPVQKTVRVTCVRESVPPYPTVTLKMGAGWTPQNWGCVSLTVSLTVSSNARSKL